MALRIPFGLSPSETWEIDYVAVTAKAEADRSRIVAEYLEEKARAKADPVERKAFEEQAEEARRVQKSTESDLAGYVAESGPIFKVRVIPPVLRSELRGEWSEIQAMPKGAASEKRLAEWSMRVISAGVCGHRNLQGRSGLIPFAAGQGGGPDSDTLSAYGPIMEPLAEAVFREQRLGAEAKNA